MITGAKSMGDLTTEEAMSGKYILSLSDLECLRNRLKKTLNVIENACSGQRGRDYDKYMEDYVKYMRLPEHQQLKDVESAIKQVSERMLNDLEIYNDK